MSVVQLLSAAQNAAAALLAAGRGDNPSQVGGIVLIAGIVVAVALLGLLAHLLLHRFGQSRPDVARRRPHRRGRVGRT
ncbi:MAG TPA: hypothetical protein VK307_05565 [Thermoleophilaceae bacterium]|nr:hypothetical protein [Thermoleophilaceae bacterium]